MPTPLPKGFSSRHKRVEEPAGPQMKAAIIIGLLTYVAAVMIILIISLHQGIVIPMEVP